MPSNTVLSPIFRLIGIFAMCYPVYVFCFKTIKGEKYIEKYAILLTDVFLGAWILVNTDLEPFIYEYAFWCENANFIIITCIKWFLCIGVYLNVTFVDWHRMKNARERKDIGDFQECRKMLIKTQIIAVVVLSLYIIDKLFW